MKAGVLYPQIELGGDTGAVKACAQAAEDLGYHHIVIYDHVLGAVHARREPKLTGPYKETDPFDEPLITYAYLAGVTKHSASSRSSNIVAGTTNGPETLRRGVKLEEATYPS